MYPSSVNPSLLAVDGLARFYMHPEVKSYTSGSGAGAGCTFNFGHSLFINSRFLVCSGIATMTSVQCSTLTPARRPMTNVFFKKKI